MSGAAGQRIGFRAVPGGRVAYAEVGDGPPLVLPTPWVSHLERDWEVPEYRAFVAALAGTHRVVRYDRLGCGLSDRPARPGTGVQHDTAVLGALVDALELASFALFGFSIGACAALGYASARPERVSRLAIFGGYAEGARTAPEALRTAILATVRAHWGAGSRLLADVWMPGVDARVRDAFARLQREATDARTAAAVLASVYDADLRGALAGVRAPTLVLHRREDRAIPFALGREVAAGIPGARFVPLEGDVHPPWLGDSGPVLDALLPFLAADTAPGRVLTEREREVLRLVAAGRSDSEIAAELFLSGHTVHRHVANIRRKLDQPSRAAAAAAAVRLGLI
ncbi:alpha/beta fold hydrolase [Cryptosporangium arvum]|uniref:Response regulator containing a CheY-like receiver domain and an HTH DNA-binding domain n=1 Tax=Cryptosporangium arvum DSM 44712 TaxID=927661 RepID=A0A010ZRY4_9ACTN|nr:alpha/beta fold hydrolase [Cryptosporangium arvum]EXG81414.1 response regulator containing a CheY-like receiver domain and an HTH DNA-binding domain [Cryptosporangium arvum DSM 44712]